MTIIQTNPGSQIYGYDGTDWVPVTVNASGNLVVTLSGGLSNVFTPAGAVNVSVGVATTLLAAANANRKFLSVSIITSGARVSLGLGAAAVLDAGITLYTAGTYVFDSSGVTTGAVNAISSIAATSVGVQEGS